MGDKESFFEKHHSKIDTAGHALNTLQNMQIKENQRKLAKLQAINLSVQEKNRKLNEQKVELLEDQKKYFNDKKKIDKQNAHVKKLMLKTAPELEELSASLQNNANNENITADYLDARFILNFLKINRGLIEDMDFQRLINDTENEINAVSDKIDFQSEYFSNAILGKLQEEVEVLRALLHILDGTNTSNINQKELNKTENILFKLHKDPIKASILNEVFNISQNKSLPNLDIGFSSELVEYAYSTTENISDYYFYKDEVLSQIEKLRSNISSNAKEEIKKYLISNYKGASGSNGVKRVSLAKLEPLFNNIDSTLNFDDDIKFKFLIQHYLVHVHYHLKLFKENESNSLERLKALTGLSLRNRDKDKNIAEIEDKLGVIKQKLPENLISRIESVANGKFKRRLDSSCFVVTVTTESRDNSVVNDYRTFRDEILAHTFFGKLLIKIYNNIGPTLAKIIKNNAPLKKAVLFYLVLPIHKMIKRYF